MGFGDKERDEKQEGHLGLPPTLVRIVRVSIKNIAKRLRKVCLFGHPQCNHKITELTKINSHNSLWFF